LQNDAVKKNIYTFIGELLPNATFIHAFAFNYKDSILNLVVLVTLFKKKGFIVFIITEFIKSQA
jgi:hypothetical protein